MAQRVVGTPVFDEPGVTVPLDLWVRRHEPILGALPFSGGRSVQDTATKRARAVPPAVTLVFQQELVHGLSIEETPPPRSRFADNAPYAYIRKEPKECPACWPLVIRPHPPAAQNLGRRNRSHYCL
jgi:hypothetical protein